VQIVLIVFFAALVIALVMVKRSQGKR